MMWTDVYDKWATGKFEEAPCEIMGSGQTVMLNREKCEAGVGDLVKEYVRVLRAPWWQRRIGWGFAEKFLRERLNIFTISWNK